MNHTRSLKIPANDLLIESLVYALTKIGQEEKAKTVIQVTMLLEDFLRDLVIK